MQHILWCISRTQDMLVLLPFLWCRVYVSQYNGRTGSALQDFDPGVQGLDVHKETTWSPFLLWCFLFLLSKHKNAIWHVYHVHNVHGSACMNLKRLHGESQCSVQEGVEEPVLRATEGSGGADQLSVVPGRRHTSAYSCRPHTEIERTTRRLVGYKYFAPLSSSRTARIHPDICDIWMARVGGRRQVGERECEQVFCSAVLMASVRFGKWEQENLREGFRSPRPVGNKVEKQPDNSKELKEAFVIPSWWKVWEVSWQINPCMSILK